MGFVNLFKKTTFNQLWNSCEFLFVFKGWHTHVRVLFQTNGSHISESKALTRNKQNRSRKCKPPGKGLVTHSERKRTKKKKR
jgi:hypothetical protein